ncbi:TPA: hypothetical protein IAC10_07825 [Candidatus Scatousia excrementigallinarum]|uniref:Uncharacterized protein n=1 Tax=Candidatus Scatousia excrementigallinarum TaxID=2840935 RepID=A0A9D1EZY0_9BACT|nr:hypothetical protein [Candidatus Scatousia excrementigallinarum]
METIEEMIANYGINNFVLALLIIITTGFAKIPLKLITAKWRNKGVNLNKYIVLLPILFGIGYAALYTYLFCGTAWSEDTLSIALTSTTLSLSIYAITEKLFEKKKNESIKEKRDCIEVTEKTDSDKTDQTKHFIIKR